MPRRSSPFLLRDARPADLATLARMGARLAREHHALDPARFFLPGEPLEKGYAWWLGKELMNPRAVILVAARRGAGACSATRPAASSGGTGTRSASAARWGSISGWSRGHGGAARGGRSWRRWRRGSPPRVSRG